MKKDLKFELALLKDIIEKKINPGKILSYQVVDGFFAEVRDIVIDETERIENEMRVAAMNIESETQKREYVLHHLVNAVRLQDKIFGWLMPKDQKGLQQTDQAATAENMYKQIFKSLVGLLEFIEKDFPDHFDRRAKAPDAQRWLLELEIENKIEGLKKELQSMAIENWLVNIACMPLESLVVSENEISFYELAFLKTLLAKMQAFVHVANYKNRTEKFLKLLFRINYNSVWFANHCIVEYKHNIKDAGNINDAINYLQEQQKMLRQQTVRKDVAFRMREKSITEELLQWICAELHTLKDEQELMRHMKKRGKIFTILSVEDLGYGGRKLHEAGLFPQLEESVLNGAPVR